MASTEHCLYCFEVLSAKLEKRTPKTLPEVRSLWAEYAKTLDEYQLSDNSLKNPIVQRLAVRTSSGSSTPSSSSSELDASTAATTPASSTSSFNPVESDDSDYPLFVTWNTLSPRHGRSLRGCIGTFEPQPLARGLRTYALTSALDDNRFDPVSLSELSSLEVAVTLLTDFEEADDAMDWDVGTHGIRIGFKANGSRYGACYLPDVAVEQGWTKEETILSLMRKGGWAGRSDKWKEVKDLQVVRYQGKAKSVEYKLFAEWSEWIKKGK